MLRLLFPAVLKTMLYPDGWARGQLFTRCDVVHSRNRELLYFTVGNFWEYEVPRGWVVVKLV